MSTTTWIYSKIAAPTFVAPPFVRNQVLYSSSGLSSQPNRWRKAYACLIRRIWSVCVYAVYAM
eukprot:9869038-Heterocapsa_arctica.AAC.1